IRQVNLADDQNRFLSAHSCLKVLAARPVFSQSSHSPIVIVGLGYVGLPLALAFARQGFRVIGLEKDERKVSQLNRGESYVGDVRSEELTHYVEVGKLAATSDPAVIATASAVVVCVPTPVGKAREPDIRAILG